jgi:undecaprenyl-phosphate 4-deoxy-4-formamido-L-arabinose transferase
MNGPDLSVVMPVYNEAALIEATVRDWVAALDTLGIDYELRIYDDGSRDATATILEKLAGDRVIVTTKPNEGHGPTVMRAYDEARGRWILQTDSDGEIAASEVTAFWNARNGYDVVLARRVGREQTIDRKILSAASRALLAILFGGKSRDANVPFRLMRREWLRAQLLRVGEKCSVPNVVLTGLASRARVLELPVVHQQRRAGTSSLNLRRLMTFAPRAALDVLRARSRA